MLIENILSALLADSYLCSNLKKKGRYTYWYYEAAFVKELKNNTFDFGPVERLRWMIALKVQHIGSLYKCMDHWYFVYPSKLIGISKFMK